METQTPHVLLVDDDEINQLVATKFLKKWKVEVTVAKNGTDALDFIKTRRFQLVMMDLHMPEMDGQECTRRIRAMDDAYFKNVPIILFSASSSIDSKQTAKDLGMTDFIDKPFRQEELKEKLSAYLSLPDTQMRSLHIDFDLHTAGDAIFKSELLHLLVENLEELRRSLDLPLSSTDPLGFIKISHKVNSALAILNDSELSNVLLELKALVARNDLTSPNTKKAIADTVRIGKELVKSMQHEIRNLERTNPTQIKQ